MKKNNILRLFQFRGAISIIYYFAFAFLLWYLIIPHTSLYFNNKIFTPFNKRLNEEDITLIKGEEFTLRVMNFNKRLYFSSTDIKVADVNIFGTVTAYRAGTTIIRVKMRDEVLKCRVRVIDINKKKLNLKAGKNYRLNVKGVWFGVSWSSGNSSIARVSRYGNVTAISKGTVKIYGKVRGKTLSCTVTVR
ncbi:hypothetical protein Ana3638_17780 [Anaerocolumna sedimenticola]|uniref:BIG2 domain-containing protein n=1 Tax=Anaerocolumna sedimenticola TaxID=2696063 RepID=A0A6P1TSD1_9FIRM|nr:Ig-like domain-containing protein [Anaerocolumna sedimenticola]QHQ62405.1 hypothetical protein Ana3638_17780 [Anaerocolumna sedimenticola]